MKHFFPIFFVVWTNLKLRSPRGHFYFVCVSPLSRCTAIIVRSWTSLFPAFLKKFCRFWKKLKKNWCRVVCRPIVFLEQFGVFWFVVSRFNCVRVTLVFFMMMALTEYNQYSWADWFLLTKLKSDWQLVACRHSLQHAPHLHNAIFPVESNEKILINIFMTIDRSRTIYNLFVMIWVKCVAVNSRNLNAWVGHFSIRLRPWCCTDRFGLKRFLIEQFKGYQMMCMLI